MNFTPKLDIPMGLASVIHSLPADTYFVTGTDTEIGKTTVTQQIIKCLALKNTTCYAIKPVTAGLAKNNKGQTYSEDAQKINTFSTIQPPSKTIAPFLLSTPCSPHLSASIDKVQLSVVDIVETIKQTLQCYPAETILIEGAGGWYTPINATQTLADVATTLHFPVIVVIGIKLGSLNHAILTLQAIKNANLTVAMVVFNQLTSDTPWFEEQVQWLGQYLLRQATPPMPPLFVINPYQLYP